MEKAEIQRIKGAPPELDVYVSTFSDKNRGLVYPMDVYIQRYSCVSRVFELLAQFISFIQNRIASS